MKLSLPLYNARLGDVKAIQEWGMPSHTLMEHAARSCIEQLQHHAPHLFLPPNSRSILILCGKGNNGGDGLAMARMLARQHSVTVLFFASDLSSCSSETTVNYHLAQKAGVHIATCVSSENLDTFDFSVYDIVVDALLGTGATGAIKEPMLSAIEKANSQQAFRIAIDIPTGIDSNTGIPIATTYFRADVVLTIGAYKDGVFLSWRKGFFPTLLIADLYLPFSYSEPEFTARLILEDADVKRCLPQRQPLSSKFSYGRVLAIGGSAAMSGGIALTAIAALRSGAGLVELIAPVIHPMLIPEIIAYKTSATEAGTLHPDAIHLCKERIEKADVIVVGPGIGQDTRTTELVKNILRYTSELGKKVVIDAEALVPFSTLLESGDRAIQQDSIICTPHTGELSRMTGIARQQIEDNPIEQAMQAAQKYGCTIHLKSVPPVTVTANRSYLLERGNNGMATAGSGDVLAGCIAGLWASGIADELAAPVGAYIHAKAGDIAARERSVQGMTAGDIAYYLQEAFL